MDCPQAQQGGAAPLKLVFIGASATGKTSIIRRYLTNSFDETQTTLNVSMVKRDVKRDGQTVQLQLWDTAGQERFDAVTPTYFRSCHSVALVVSLDQLDSLHKAKYWLGQVRQSADSGVIVYLVVNKCDLRGTEVQLPEQLVVEFASAHALKSFFVSAKTGECVNAFIDQVVGDFVELPRTQEEGPVGKLVVRDGEQHDKRFRCC